MRRSGRDLLRNTDGAVAPTIALSLVGLIAAGGIAFDYARLAAMDTELQNAADQAALAAATQLDGKANAGNRAVAAAQSLLANQTRFANDGSGISVQTGQSVTSGGVTSRVRVHFYQTKADAEADTNSFDVTDANVDTKAHFVKVEVTERRANYALTPVAAAFSSGDIGAEATAGLGSAVCKVPPLMICNPRPSGTYNPATGSTFDPDAMKGIGVQVTGHGNDRDGTNTTNSTWATGDFGFLDVGSGQNADLIKAMAFQSSTLECELTDSGSVTTGNPQGLYDAVNTRFDIYDFSSGNGTALAPCFSGSCPSAPNAIKDVVKNDTSTNGNGCKLTTNNQGWHLPATQFSPRPYVSTDDTTVLANQFSSVTPTAMGLPRDLCHYTSYNRTCAQANGTSGTSSATNKFGDGNWARGDYWARVHPTLTPPSGANTWTRYQTYLWESQDTAARVPYGQGSGNDLQYGRPVCSSGTVAAGTDRRVISVAIVENCASLNGASRTVVISNFADMFLVEPTVDGRGNGSMKDSIYMEVIGRTRGTGTGSQSAQTVRRDVPYLVR
jgi:Flp pilus assembly protein TadG